MSAYINPCLAGIEGTMSTRRHSGFLETLASRVTSDIRHTTYRSGPKTLALAFLLALPVGASASGSTEAVIRQYFADAPVLVKIARCESNFQHFDEYGRVLKNPDSEATGAMQIMASLHRRDADRLGLDITELYGNLTYARYLYEQKGTRPWQASRVCWENAP